MLLILLGTNSSTSTCSHHTQYRNHLCASATLVEQGPQLKLLPPRTSYCHEGRRQKPALQASRETKEENTHNKGNNIKGIPSYFHLCFHLFPFGSDEMDLNETIFYTAFHTFIQSDFEK